MNDTSTPHVLGALELDSVAAGLDVLDIMVKEAPITVIDARTICPGKYVLLIGGEEAAVEASLSVGGARHESCLLDRLYIPHLHPDVWDAVHGRGPEYEMDAVGVLESFSLIGAIEAGDAAAKEADVRVIHIRWGGEMGGKSSVKVVGPVGEVEIAVSAGSRILSAKDYLCNQVVVARPHADVAGYVTRG
jgi:microcompartment protein CcmL/EutN